MSTFNVLYLSSECTPFVKVGGLADVANAYPRFLKEKDHDIRVLLPKYKVIKDRKYNLREVIRLRDIEVPLAGETILVSVKSGFIPDSKVQAYFLEYKPFFDRIDPYVNSKTGEGYEDNHMRFALFAKTAFEMLKVLYWQPDLIHVNDWPSALVPYYLKTFYKDDPFFENIKTLLTIHNIGYQGVFDGKISEQLDPEGVTFDENHPAWQDGNYNFLKAGIETADMVTTVSPTYAQEILTDPNIGAGLGELLKKKNSRFVGVLNGIDDDVWNPETDDLIEENYSVEEPAGKAANRKALCDEFELECDDDTLIIGMVSRLAGQKGFDLLIEAMPELARLPVRLVLLGKGQADILNDIKQLTKDYPDTLKATLNFDNQLAHRIEAGSDVFLMPSAYEPCGLNQMYSQRYGTPPIVTKTGGLADTVQDYDPKTGEGSGFIMTERSADALVEAIKRATELYKDKDAWNKLMLSGMQRKFGWGDSLEKMVDAYATTTGAVEEAQA